MINKKKKMTKKDFSDMTIDDINLEHKLGRSVTDADLHASVTCNFKQCTKEMLQGCNFLCKAYEPKTTEGRVCQNPRYNERED